jgi:hypothetical protein
MPKKTEKKDAFAKLRENIRELAARTHGGGIIENVVNPILGIANKKAKQNVRKKK